MSSVIGTHGNGHAHGHEHGHDEHGAQHGPYGGIMRWITTTNHKEHRHALSVVQLHHFMTGGAMAMVIRAELFEPVAVRRSGPLQQMLTMHGLIMVFGAIMPVFVGFANWQIPMMIGAPDMAFARLNNWSFWLLPFAATLLMLSFFVEGGAPGVGWTLYAPLTVEMGPGMDLTIFAVHLLA